MGLTGNKRARVKALDDMLEDRGLDPRQQRITGARISTSQVGMKVKKSDGTHEVVVTPLKHTQIVMHPRKAEGPKWPLIRQSKPTIVKYERPNTKRGKTELERVVIIPDVQIGYYRLANGKLEPFHDLQAIDIMLQVIAEFEPHRIVILGDFLDLPELSRYLQIKEFVSTLQPAIDYGHKLLARVRSAAGAECVIDYLDGNHERRLPEWITVNAKAAFGIKRAAAAPDEWDVLSVPFLLRLDELNIKYSQYFPSGEVWLNRRIVCTHQPRKNPADLPGVTVISGHHPRNSSDSRRIHEAGGASAVSEDWTVGGLMRVDVSRKRNKNQLVGTAVPSADMRTNWTQGIAVLSVKSANQFAIEPIKIEKGRALWRGQEYVGRALG